MAQTATMTISQGSNPSQLTVRDTTVNPETYTNRTLVITDSVGNPFPGYTNPIPFTTASYPANVITLTGLTVDLSLNVIMTQTVASPVGGSTYSAVEDAATNRFLQQGVYNIQAARFLENQLPGQAGVIAQTASYDIIIEELNSQTAVAYGSLVNSQSALTRGQNIINAQII